MNKTTLALLAILVILVLAAYLLMQRPGEQSISSAEGEFFVLLDSLAVDKIEIQSPNSFVVLEKQRAEWYVQRPVEDKADKKKVGTFIENVKNLRIGAVVSTNPEKQSLFQVDSSGTMVRLYEKGSVTVSFVIGKMGTDFSDVYVRRENSRDVMTVGTSVSYDARRSPNDWRDHTVLSIPRESISEVRFQYGDTTFVLARRDTAWMIGREAANEQAVNSFLSAMSSLECDDFLDAPSSSASKPTALISLAGVQVRFVPQKGNDSYAVQTSFSSRWYELRSWRANQVLKRKKDLLTP